MSYLIYYITRIVAVICVFSPHEFAHAYVAYKNGDPTAKFSGRMTLNPIKHFDPAGFILCIFVGFGWAKPVPVNAYNFRKRKLGMFTTAVAGVIANYIVAFVAYLCYVLCVKFITIDTFGTELLMITFYMIFLYSVYSFVFNLLPLYPLDGFRVVESFTRQINPVRRFLHDYGQWILIALLVWSYFCGIMDDYYSIFTYFDLFYYIGWFAKNIIAFPINVSWNWILKI